MTLEMNDAPGIGVPMVLASTTRRPTGSTLHDMIDEHRDKIVAQLHHRGAIVFRGFACDEVECFSKAIELCGLGRRCSTKDYDLPRTHLPNEIYTSSDLPPHISLALHHEKPRSKYPPHHLYFCCVTPPTKGGGTLFANALAVWSAMPKKIQEKVLANGVVYKQFFHGETIKHRVLRKMLDKKSLGFWPESFATHERRQIEQTLVGNDVGWEWVNDDLIVLNRLPGILEHPITHQISWFNAAHYLNYYSNIIYGELSALRSYPYVLYKYLILKDMLPMVCHYGDGQPFSFDDILAINQVLRRHTGVFNWQKGDFMIVDNVTFMHGKEAHCGARLLYSCMTTIEN